jgi:hypothetical protein
VGTWARNVGSASILAVVSAESGCGLELSGTAAVHGDAGVGSHIDDASAIDDRTLPNDGDAALAAPDTATDAVTGGPPTPIGFVQVAAVTPQTPTAVASVPYAKAQTAGNLNIVVVGWNDTIAQVTSVADSSGNVYALAVGPTTESNQLSQSIYYGANTRAAAPGANVVSVKFNVAAKYVDLRIVEYQGIATVNPLDQVSPANGTAAAASAPAVTTSSSPELVVAAGITTGAFQPVSAPFVQRIITMPDGDDVVDEIATSVGSYGVTVQQSGAWVMQLASFRAGP